jgi:hypothetical protein
MAGRITPGPNALTVNDLFKGSFVTAADGKPALVVVNDDGTSISGGGGGGSATVVGIGPLGLSSIPYDSVTYTATSGTVDTYKYYTGGTGGTLQATVTITYTDSSHATLVSAVRT